LCPAGFDSSGDRVYLSAAASGITGKQTLAEMDNDRRTAPGAAASEPVSASGGLAAGAWSAGATAGDAAALSVRDLRKTYKSGTEALKGVSLEIPRGDFFALLGPNGAGKTTVIGIVTGLVEKTGGTVAVFGNDIDSHPQHARHDIGVVPQEMNFNIFEKVIEIVVTQAGYYGIPRRVAYPRAEEVLKQLGLYEKRNEISMALSGGMKRRLMIARALIHQPKLLILDEPTAGVDVELRRGMWDFLRRLTGQGVTILLTTHYLEEAEQLCKHVAIINRGEIIASGTVADILSRLKTETVILELAQPQAAQAAALLGAYKAKAVGPANLEVDIDEGVDLSPAIRTLDAAGIAVRIARAKSGRLEEVFMRLTSQAQG